MKKLIIFLFVMSPLVIGSSISDSGSNTPKDKKDYYKEFTPMKLHELLKEKGVRFPSVVFSQAILETGHFKSKVWRENHNLFGMRLAKKRPTTAIGSKHNHAVYTDWMESVSDYLLWQTYVLKDKSISSDKEYLEFLDSYGYSESGKYRQTVNKIMKNYMPRYLTDNSYWESKMRK